MAIRRKRRGQFGSRWATLASLRDHFVVALGTLGGHFGITLGFAGRRGGLQNGTPSYGWLNHGIPNFRQPQPNLAECPDGAQSVT